MRVVHSLALLCALVSFSQSSFADNCKFWQFNCVGEESAKQMKAAIDKLGENAVKSADVAFSAINYWPWLISKYHTGTPEEKANAQKIVKEVFGADSLEGVQPFEITFNFEGIDSDKQKLSFILLRDYVDPDVVGKVYAGNTIDFVPHLVTGKSWPVKESYASYVGDTAVVREKVRLALEGARAGSTTVFRFGGIAVRDHSKPLANVAAIPMKATCVSLDKNARGHDANGMGDVTCDTHPAWKDAHASEAKLVDAIMTVTDPKLDKLGSRPSLKFAYEGYKFLTLVFPEDELKANPQMKLGFTIHPKGKPDQPLPIMTTGPWERTQAQLLYGGQALESKGAKGRYIAYVVNLGVTGPPAPVAKPRN
jgi:hypothetical protein